MKLYVCFGDWKQPILGHRHPCGDAHQALLDDGTGIADSKAIIAWARANPAPAA